MIRKLSTDSTVTNSRTLHNAHVYGSTWIHTYDSNVKRNEYKFNLKIELHVIENYGCCGKESVLTFTRLS